MSKITNTEFFGVVLKNNQNRYYNLAGGWAVDITFAKIFRIDTKCFPDDIGPYQKITIRRSVVDTIDELGEYDSVKKDWSRRRPAAG